MKKNEGNPRRGMPRSYVDEKRLRNEGKKSGRRSEKMTKGGMKN